MSSLINELTRLALEINREWMEKLQQLKTELGDNEFVYERLICVYLYPTGTPDNARIEFIKKLPLERLRKLIDRGEKKAGEIAVSVAKTIPRFLPQKWETFERCIDDIVRIAKQRNWELSNVFKAFIMLTNY